jgi:IS4 transposase
MALLTNRLDLSAVTIAAIYKERWQVELFNESIAGDARSVRRPIPP